MSMLPVRSDPGGLRTLPPELHDDWQGQDGNRGWHRLRRIAEAVENHGGPQGLTEEQRDRVQGLVTQRRSGPRLIGPPVTPGPDLYGLGDYYDENGNLIQSDTLTVDPNVPTWISSDPPPITPEMIASEMASIQAYPTPSLSPQQMQALEAASGLRIAQTAPAGSNTPAPSGMEWLTVADHFNNSLLKILVASKPGTYMQQLPNGMVLYSQQPGATGIPGLMPTGAGGSVQTPLGSASFSGAMPLLIGGLVLLMFMGKR